MIPLFRAWVSPNAADAVRRVLETNPSYIGQGPVVEAFESRLSERVGSPFVLTTNSGTSALDLALATIGVGPGDEVISTPMTCSATNHAINNTGARIVWADIDPISGLISPESIAAAITPRTKAIMVVDWAGERVDVAAIRRFSGQPIVVDAAHRAPSRDDRYVAEGNTFIAYSFQAIKFLTTGDGGALVVPELYFKAAKLRRWFGLDRESSSNFRCAQRIELAGGKWHMNDIAAAIGLENLNGLGERVAAHAQNYARFASLGICHKAETHGWVAFCQVRNRSDFQRFMADRGISTSLVHSRNDAHPVFAGAKSTPLEGLEKFDRTYCAIPCGWWLTEMEVDHIAESVLAWEKEHGRPE